MAGEAPGTAAFEGAPEFGAGPGLGTGLTPAARRGPSGDPWA
jgi:hypothetical protein